MQRVANGRVFADPEVELVDEVIHCCLLLALGLLHADTQPHCHYPCSAQAYSASADKVSSFAQALTCYRAMQFQRASVAVCSVYTERDAVCCR